MIRPDIEAIRDRCGGAGEDVAEGRIDTLLAHIDATEAALRAAVERCPCQAFQSGDEPCRTCRAALALLDEQVLSTDSGEASAWCPECGGSGRSPVVVDPYLDHARPRCPTCEGEGTCDPIPVRGRQGLWEVQP